MACGAEDGRSTLESSVLGMQRHLNTLSDLCVTMVRAYMGFRAQHADLVKEVRLLCSTLRQGGLLDTEEARRNLLSHQFIRLFEEPHVAVAIMLAGGARTGCSLCTASSSCMCSIVEGTARGAPFQFLDSGDATCSRGSRPLAPEGRDAASAAAKPAAGKPALSALAALLRCPRIAASLIAASGPSSLRDMRSASRALRPLAAGGPRQPRPREYAEASPDSPGRCSGLLAKPLSARRRHEAAPAVGRSNSPGRHSAASGGGLGCLALLQDVWQYSTLADALACAMEPCSIRRFQTVSRAGRECLRLVLGCPPLPPLLPREASPGRGGSGALGSGFAALLEETWRSAALAGALASSTGATAHRLSAVSRAGRECVRRVCWGRPLVRRTARQPVVVRLHGLSHRPELNGMTGVLVESSPPADRCHVVLAGGDRIRVRRANLQLAARTRVAVEPGGRHGLLASGPAPLQLPPSLGHAREAAAPRLAALERGAIFLCGGVTQERHVTQSAYFFLPHFSSWHPLPPLSQARSHACSAVVDGCLYVVGGQDQFLSTGLVERFDLKVGRWEPLPEMPRPRCFASIAVINRDLYVAGGCRQGGASTGLHHGTSRALERFSTTAKAWRVLPSMLHPRSFATASVLGGDLHILGGCSESDEMLGSMERFNPELGLWTGISQLPWKCAFGAHAVFCDFLYLFGGGSDEHVRSAARFGCQTGQWQMLPPMTHGRFGAVAVTAPNGDFFVCGGSPARSGSVAGSAPPLECFRSTLGFWELLFHCKLAQNSFASAVRLDGHVYIIGGRARGGEVTDAAARMDVRSGVLRALPPMPEALIGFSCVALLPPQQ